MGSAGWFIYTCSCWQNSWNRALKSWRQWWRKLVKTRRHLSMLWLNGDPFISRGVMNRTRWVLDSSFTQALNIQYFRMQTWVTKTSTELKRLTLTVQMFSWTEVAIPLYGTPSSTTKNNLRSDLPSAGQVPRGRRRPGEGSRAQARLCPCHSAG